MAFRYFTRKSEAQRLARALMAETGYQPSTFVEDGLGRPRRRLWRIQEDRVGNDRMDEIMGRLNLLERDR